MLPSGVSVAIRDHVPGSVKELEIFQRMKEVLFCLRRKFYGEGSITDWDLRFYDHPKHEPILFDNEYEKAQEFLCTIRQKKKPIMRSFPCPSSSLVAQFQAMA